MLGQWAWAFSGGGLTQITESLVDSNLTYTLDVMVGTELPGPFLKPCVRMRAWFDGVRV